MHPTIRRFVISKAQLVKLERFKELKDFDPKCNLLFVHVGVLRLELQDNSERHLPAKFSELNAGESFVPSIYKRMQKYNTEGVSDYKIKTVKSADLGETILIKFDALITKIFFNTYQGDNLKFSIWDIDKHL